MLGRWRTGLLLVVLGVFLVANPWWAFGGPGWLLGDPPTESDTYGAERVTRVPESVLMAGPILDCAHVHVDTRACRLERAVAERGTIRLDVPAASLDRRTTREDSGIAPARVRSHDHPYVRLDSGFYRPTANASDGSVVLSLEPASEREVLDFLAYDYDLAPRVAARTVENGSVTVTRPADDRAPLDADDLPMLVERDGAFYLVEHPVGDRSDRPSEIVVEATRLGGWIGGLALVLYGRELQVRSWTE